MRTRTQRTAAADQGVRGALGRVKAEYGLTDAELARAAGIAPRTWSCRNRDPGRFTLAELRAMYPITRWTDEEIARMVRG